MKQLRIRKTIFLLLFCINFLLNGQAQEVYDLSNCISKGLERNFSLQVIRNREQVAGNNYTRGNAGFLPTVTTTNRIGGTVISTNQSLRDGTSSESKGIHNISGSAGVTLAMTVFKGFSIQTTYQKLSELKRIGELSTQVSVENLIGNIAAEYNYYIQQQTLYNNLKYAVSLSRERVRIDEQRYILGASSKLQLLQSKVYLNADSSRLAKQNEVLRASQIRLNELMASPNLGEYITLKDSLIQIDESLQFDNLLNSTLENNTSLQIAARNQVVSEMDYRIISSASLPYLNFSSGYAYNYNTFETGPTKNQKSHGANYGLTLGMELFDGFNNRRERVNARIDMDNKQLQYREVEQTVKADLITIFYGYENNLRLLNLERENLGVATENLDIALERYKLGSLSGLELREVQKSLLDAEERLISVQYQTKLAEISLLQIAGKIMDYVK